jgi:hypothetical protein
MFLMTYRTRMRVCLAVSFAVHAAVFVQVPLPGFPERTPAPAPSPEPVVLQLQPPQQPQPKRLIDVTTPTQDPVDELTDLIAEANSRAADAFDADSDTNAPRVEEVGEFDRIAAPPPMPQPTPPPAPPVQPAPEPTPEPVEQEEASPDRMEVAQLMQPPEAVQSQPAPPQPPIQQQPPQPPPPESADADVPTGNERGRVQGGVKSKGFLGFEAKQHEFAPYLKVIRNRVERHWKQAILLRFSGATPRKAVLDCAIAPDGRLVEVTIVETGGSGTYAEMCRQAILDAGPFPPFPFEVPPGYRSENIEIRWTFSYL